MKFSTDEIALRVARFLRVQKTRIFFLKDQKRPKIWKTPKQSLFDQKQRFKALIQGFICGLMCRHMILVINWKIDKNLSSLSPFSVHFTCVFVRNMYLSVLLSIYLRSNKGSTPSFPNFSTHPICFLTAYKSYQVLPVLAGTSD